MKILNLILYSNNDDYKKMYNLLKCYLQFVKEKINIDYYFYTFNNDIENEFEVKDDIFYIKGEETFLPGILDKTIKTIEYFKDYDYDYIIRSNISTPINFELLINFLEKFGFDYCGNVFKICWEDRKCGLINKKYFNEFFISGACITMSKNTYTYLIDHKEELDYTVIDDVAIGVLLTKQFEPINIYKYFMINDTDQSSTKLFTIDRQYHNNILYYRNKSINRGIDLFFINKNINSLIKNFNTYDFNNTYSVIIYNNDDSNLQICCEFIRKYYDCQIIIISNDDVKLENIENYKNVIYYNYYNIGILSAYYYFFNKKPSKKALIINASTILKSYIDIENVFKLQPLNIVKNISINNLDFILSDFSLSNELNMFVKSHGQISYDSCEMVIDYDMLDLINKRHNLFNIIINNIIYI